MAANNQGEFEGELTSLSASAVKALKRLGSATTALQGSLYWMYGGETLDERRQRMEAAQFEGVLSPMPAAMMAQTYFAERAARADLTAFDRLMQRETGTKPQDGDQI